MKTYSRFRNVLVADLDRVCRICLDRLNRRDLLPMFDQDMLPDIQLRIMFCLGFEVTPEESLPNMICVDCYNEIDRFYSFKKKCQITYELLKSRVTTFNNITPVTLTVCNDQNSEAEVNENFLIEPETIVCKNSAVQESSLLVDDRVKPLTSENSEDVLGNTNTAVVNDNQAAVLVTENLVTPIVKEEVPNAVRSVINEIQLQTEENLYCAILSQKLLKSGMLEADGDTLNCNRNQNGIFNLEMIDGTLVTYCLQEESENEEDDAVTITLPAGSLTCSRPIQYECVHCRQRFDRRDAYRRHIQRHVTEDKQFVTKWCCGVCGKQCPSRSALARHRRVHSGERPFRCDQCPRAFSQKEVLMRHTATHSERKPFACSSCPKSFTQRMGLVMHMRSHAPPNARALQLHRCQKCSKVFLYASGLSRHQVIHEGRGFSCPDCSRMFVDKSSLKRHRQTAHTAVSAQSHLDS